MTLSRRDTTGAVPQTGGGSRERSRKVPHRLLLAGIALLALGAGLLTMSASAATRVDVGQIPTGDLGTGTSAGVGGAPPRSISIPAIGVDATITAVGVGRDRHLAVPTAYQDVGWWRGGAGLGTAAPVVLVGHVDDSDGPAVFYHLANLRPGEQVRLTGTDGRVTTYLVDGLRQYPDNKFPDEVVYGRTARSTLRLITCAGYSWLRGGHYRDNVVVYAHAQTPG